MKKVIFVVILVFCFATVCFSQSVDFCIPIPSQHVTTVRDSLCIIWDYEGNRFCSDPEDPNTCDTQKQFIVKKIQQMVKNKVNNFLQETAVNVARRDAPQLDF